MAGAETQLAIVRYGDPILSGPVPRVGRVTARIEELVARMTAAMRAANGLGLAANQIGVPLQVAVVEARAAQADDEGSRPKPPVSATDDGVIVLVDPELVEAEGCVASDEGCLSLPRLYGLVERPARVVVRALDLTGKRITVAGEGLFARALCHEIDHLNGRLFVDLPPPENKRAAAGYSPRPQWRERRKGGAIGNSGRLDRSSLYWLLGHNEEGEPITRRTTLEDAVRTFLAARTRAATG